jgi:hypothetical protein
MSDLGTLKAFITADNTGLLAATRESTAAVESMSKNIGRSLRDTGASISNFGKSLTIGLTLPIAAAGAGIVKLASDAEEAGSKFRTVFKDVGAEASAAAKELSTSFGLSNVQAQQLLGNTGDLLSGFGFTGEAALDLATKTNQLAVDLASFTNVEGGAQRASQALTKALLGERESVKELGIAILESDVQAQVARNTAKGLTFDTMRQAKAYATLELATQQSKNAIGDFARTQTSVANQFRILRARASDVAVSFGQMLLPLVNKIVGRLIGWVEAFMALDSQTKAIIIVAAGLAAVMGPLIFVFGKLVTLAGVVFSMFGAIAGVIGFLLSPIGLLVVGLGAVVAILVKTGKAAEVVGKIWVGLRTTLALVMSGIATVLSTLTFAFQSFLKGINLVASAVGIDLPEGFNNFIGALDDVQARLDEFAQDQATTAAEMSMNWGDAWGAFKEDMVGALEFAEGFLTEKGVNIKELLAEIAKGMEIRPPGGDEEPITGPGSQQEQANLDKSTTAWQKWLAEQRQFSKVWENTWSQTAVNVADGFAEGFADAIVSGRSFKSVMLNLAQSTAKDLIAQALRSAIAQIAINKTVTATNAAASAPNPYLIPLYVGLALALFAGVAGGLGGGGGGGGGGAGVATGGGRTDTSSTALASTSADSLAVTQYTGPSNEAGEGGSDRQQAAQPIVLEIDGEAIANVVVKQTKNGVGDGSDTLALATGEE